MTLTTQRRLLNTIHYKTYNFNSVLQQFFYINKWWTHISMCAKYTDNYGRTFCKKMVKETKPFDYNTLENLCKNELLYYIISFGSQKRRSTYLYINVC